MTVLPPLITALLAKATVGTATRGNYLFAVIEGSDQGSTSMADVQSMGRIRTDPLAGIVSQCGIDCFCLYYGHGRTRTAAAVVCQGGTDFPSMDPDMGRTRTNLRMVIRRDGIGCVSMGCTRIGSFGRGTLDLSSLCTGGRSPAGERRSAAFSPGLP
jgi:hypothetical protein